MFSRRQFLGTSLAAPLLSASPRFRFRSDFWINLHHFVRAEARRRMLGATRALPSLEDSVLETYERHARASLIFDKELVALKDALVEGSRPSQALQRAADVYRDQIWPSQDRENRFWIERVEPSVARDSPRVMKQLGSAYGAKWLKGAILVDVCPDTGPTLAYTTGRPRGTAGHVVIDPGRCAELDVAFEIVFHEASHTVDDQIVAALNGVAARVGRKAPEDLWHAIIFHTAGFAASRARPRPDFVPYARRFNIHPQFWRALDDHWQPWLEGKISRGEALEGLVRAAYAGLRGTPLLRLEGKEYIVQDGDVLVIRHG